MVKKSIEILHQGKRNGNEITEDCKLLGLLVLWLIHAFVVSQLGLAL